MNTIVMTRPTIDKLDLTKGSVISVEIIEAMVNVEFGTNEYNFALIKLVQEIDNNLCRKGNIFTLCCVKGAIHILTDEDAVAYNAKASEQAIRKMDRAHTRAQAVDKRNLDDVTRVVHSRNLAIQGRILTEINRVKEEFLLEETPRKTPGLLR